MSIIKSDINNIDGGGKIEGNVKEIKLLVTGPKHMDFIVNELNIKSVVDNQGNIVDLEIPETERHLFDGYRIEHLNGRVEVVPARAALGYLKSTTEFGMIVDERGRKLSIVYTNSSREIVRRDNLSSNIADNIIETYEPVFSERGNQVKYAKNVTLSTNAGVVYTTITLPLFKRKREYVDILGELRDYALQLTKTLKAVSDC